VGFEWDNREDVWKKVEEETGELVEAVRSDKKEDVEEEFGDLLFSLVNYARFLQIDAEAALERTNKKFMYRFQEMEKLAAEKGLQLANMSLEAMDELWNEIKKKKVAP
jgi:XTP/dITP diphosphohydrolase